MTKIIDNGDATFTLQPGTYLVGGGGHEDGFDHPDSDFELFVEFGSAPALHLDVNSQGIDMLVVPIGTDRFGVAERTIQIGKYAFVGGDALFVCSVEQAMETNHVGSPYANEYAFVSFDTPVILRMQGNTLTVGDIAVDLDRAGYMAFEGHVLDMEEPGLAKIIGYGPDAYMCEHGMGFYPDEDGPVVAALVALGTPTALALSEYEGYLYYSRGPAAVGEEMLKAA